MGQTTQPVHSTLKRSCARGITLIEALVAITIIAMMVGLFIPALASAREGARLHKCLANVRTIGQALTNFADDHDETFPCWSGWQVWGEGGAGGDQPGEGWAEQLSEYTGGRAVHACPQRPATEAPFAYFMQARYSYISTRKMSGCLRPHQVQIGSMFVLAGDCNNRSMYAAPYGPSENLPDCDLDDATEPAIFFDGEASAHAGRSNLVMLDGHACAMSRSSCKNVTWDGTRMASWDEAPGVTVQGPR